VNSLYHNTHEFSFLGVTSQQSYADFIAWEIFFNRYKINSMIELGTGNGGMALYFLLQAMQRGFSFKTWDIRLPKQILTTRLYITLKFSNHYFQADAFESVEIINASFSSTTLLYCDNGDKPKEVAIFSPYLTNGDYLAVHDWGKEIFAEQIPDYCKPLMIEESINLGSITRFFQIQKPV